MDVIFIDIFIPYAALNNFNKFIIRYIMRQIYNLLLITPEFVLQPFSFTFCFTAIFVCSHFP